MGDLEHAISPEGFREGYTFDQTDATVLLTFPVPDTGANPPSVEFLVNEDDSTIYASASDREPSICGTLFGRIARKSMTLEGGVCRIELQKAEPGPWNLAIASESARGIDPKSLFMLGIKEETTGFAREAWARFKQAADRGYVPAKLLVADALTNEYRYGVERNEAEAIEILQSIPEEKRTPPIMMTLGELLVQVGRKEEGRAVLAKAAECSPEARLRLVRLLQEMPDPTGENTRERVHHLGVLAASDNAAAMQMLAQCYASGKGVPKDEKRAKALAQRARELDPSLPDAFEVSGLATTVLVATAISTVCLGTAFLVWRLRRRK